MYSFDNVNALLLCVWDSGTCPTDVASSPRKMFNIIKRASKDTSGNGGSKKKEQHQSTLFSDGNEVHWGLNKAHKGKNLLILAKVLYSG